MRRPKADANRATEAAAEANARAQAVAQLLTQAEQRARRLEEQFGRLREERDRIGAQAVDPAALGCGRRPSRPTAEAALADGARGAGARPSRRARRTGTRAGRGARAAVARPRLRSARLAAEAQALAEVLAVKDGERWPPMVDALRCRPGWKPRSARRWARN